MLFHPSTNLKCFLFQIINNYKNKIDKMKYDENEIDNIARDTACRSDYPLDWEKNNAMSSDYNVPLGEEDECKGYWNEAKRVMNMFQKWRLYKEFKTSYKIKISDLDVTCYRPELFANKGWCKLASDNKKWGFCSSSCRVDYMKV